MKITRSLSLLAASAACASMLAATTPAAQAAPAPIKVTTAMAAVAPTAGTGPQAASGTWNGWGYRLTWAETNQIANLSLWSAVSSVKGTRLIPFSAAITGLYAVIWILTARNARATGQCLGINWVGTGLIVRCNA